MHIVLIGLILRFIISFFFSNVVNHDTIGWLTVGTAVLHNENIYPFPAKEFHAFLPAFLYIDALAVWLQKFGMHFMFVIKIICSFFDSGIIYLIYLLSKKNKAAAWIYALNPISIMIICIHGQFESIPIFFLLLGVYLIKRKNIVWSGIVFGTAVAFKTWPLLFTVAPIKRVWKIKYLLYILLVPIIFTIMYIMLFHSSIIDIIHFSLFYRGQTGNFGPGLLLGWAFINSQYLQQILTVLSNLFLFLFLMFSLFNRKREVIDEILDQMLFFFILSPTNGIQWLMWIVPFLIIIKPRWLILFLISATIYIGNVNVYWILGGRNEYLLRYMPQLGLLTWGSLVVIALYRGNGLKRYIIVAQKNLTDNKRGKQHKH